MATMRISNEVLTFEFQGMERFWLGRRTLTVPLRSVRQVAYADRPLRLARGMRRGYLVSGVVKIGVWGLLTGPRQLVYARRGIPGLHLWLDSATVDGGFDEVVFSTRDAARLVRTIAQSIAATEQDGAPPGQNGPATEWAGRATGRAGTAPGPRTGERA
ncbi:hypothetical protein [Plantactinospora soyae]|uniref:Uncharacterized protein n=1 Tax=Plantactinospora soyae TaxID=1544732 RepID=A0A927M534_9ACTN|nr:hypothetical protein [Plantactinospora soyae]MBE1484630.1 hypothetical protein [Plantactinospora soyae]